MKKCLFGAVVLSSAVLAACTDNSKSIDDAILENCEYNFHCEGEMYGETYEQYVSSCQVNKSGYHLDKCKEQVIALMECPITKACSVWNEIESEKEACSNLECDKEIEYAKGCLKFQEELDKCTKEKYAGK